jgi:hypothetical protein
MNRYYLVADADLPTANPTDGHPSGSDFGIYHYIALDSHGTAGANWNLLAMSTSDRKPFASWLPLPPLIDQKTFVASVLPAGVLSDLGVTGDHTALDLAMILGEIVSTMGI